VESHNYAKSVNGWGNCTLCDQDEIAHDREIKMIDFYARLIVRLVVKDVLIINEPTDQPISLFAISCNLFYD